MQNVNKPEKPGNKSEKHLRKKVIAHDMEAYFFSALKRQFKSEKHLRKKFIAHDVEAYFLLLQKGNLSIALAC